MVQLAEGVRIVDADAHMTERHDLFTERAPKGYEDRVPQVHEIDGIPTWTMDGHTLARAGASVVVADVHEAGRRGVGEVHRRRDEARIGRERSNELRAAGEDGVAVLQRRERAHFAASAYGNPGADNFA